MSDDPIDTYGLDPADGDRSYEWSLNQSAPIDWPDRFRKAADAAEEIAPMEAYGNLGVAVLLRDLAQRVTDNVRPDVVEAIGRALTEDGGQDR